LADGVTERGLDEASARDLPVLGACPGEERVDEGADGLVTPLLALNGGELGELAVGIEDRIDPADPVESERMAADGGFPVFPARMRLIPSSG
jgi:hypothetical protein